MSVSVEASSLLREIVSPREPGESVKALWLRASRKTGLSFSRVTKLWYGLPARIGAEEMDVLRRAAAGKRVEAGSGAVDGRERERIRELESSLAELHALVAASNRKLDALLAREAVEAPRESGVLVRPGGPSRAHRGARA